MKNFYKTCVLGVCMTLATLLVNTNQLFASHAQGADISYQCLGGNNYQLMVSFYRDCSGVGAPANVTVNLSSASCGQNLNVTLFPIAGTGIEVSPVCASMSTTCTGGAYPGVQEWKYSGTVTLPASCSDWVFSFTLCCRNAAINTINAPGSENIYVEANLDNLNYPCNNSPVFSNPPVPYVCVGQTYCFNHGATDADGDSLSYSLITPMTGAATTVTYLPPWTATQPVSSLPALTVDPLTGDICMTPQLLEVTVMAVLVEEWRGGVLIGSVIRDIQVRVINCSNTVPTITGINGGTSFSTSVCAGSTLSFDIFSTDEDLGQILTVTWNNAITGATFTTAGSPYPTGTFTWTPTAADISSTPYCFTVTVTDDACPFNGSQTFAFCITVTGLGVTVTPSDANCGASNGSATSTVSGGTGPYTYNWSSGSTQNFDTGIPAGYYTLTVTDASGCLTTTNFTIGSGAAPGNINFTTNNVNCFGGSTGSISANVTGPGTGPGMIYSWSNGASTSAISGLPAGLYILTITTTTGCISSDSVLITQPATPLAASLTKSNVSCNGMNDGTATVTPSGGTTPYTISWSTGATTSVITGLNGGFYSCAVVDANGCGWYDSILVIEPAAIVVNSTTINNVSCAGLVNGSCSLGLSGGTGALGVTWTTVPVQTGLTASGLGSGVYSYTVTDANGCSLSNPITISEPLPLTMVVTPTNITCNGLNDGTIQVIVNGGTGPYAITVNSTAMMSGATLSGLFAGSYTAIVTDANGCSISQVVSLTEPAPVSLITSPDLTICPGAFVTIYAYASGGSGVYTYSWNNGLGNNDSHVVNPAMNTTYTVTVTDQNGCMSLVGTTLVMVNDINNVTLTITGNHPICKGESIALTADVTGGQGIYTYSWNGGTLTGPGPHTFYPLADTSYTVTITDVCANTLTEIIPVTVHPLPVVVLPPVNASACGSISVEFSNSQTSQPGDQYFWTINEVNLMGENPAFIFTQSGTYTIELTVVSMYGCSTSVSSTATINVFPQADAVIDAVDHSVSEFTPTVQFLNASLFASSYSWDFGDGNTSTLEEPNHVYDAQGNYTVTMIATNQYGCSDTVTLDINIHPEHTLYVPNAFTPNSDGFNDLFMAKGTHILEYEMMIFDRWGELVYTSQSLDNGWDGTYKGDAAKEDVYVYKIKYKTNESEVLTKEGHLSLLK